jgi:hypothetical protein
MGYLPRMIEIAVSKIPEVVVNKVLLLNLAPRAAVEASSPISFAIL